MHSTRPNSNISFPHSFLYCPIHEIPNDYNSRIVAYVYGGFSWDFALRFLLPDIVEGIVVEIRNTCNQSGMFELSGHNAYYLGTNAPREHKYDSMEIVRDLTISTHPNFTTTPGHCRYTVVSIDTVAVNSVRFCHITF